MSKDKHGEMSADEDNNKNNQIFILTNKTVLDSPGMMALF